MGLAFQPILVWALLSLLGTSVPNSGSRQGRLEIELLDFRYVKPKPSYTSNKATFNNPHLLLQDDHIRLCFVSENMLAVYFSQNNNPLSALKSGVQLNGDPLLKAFFFNTDSGALIAQREWHTLERQFFNDSYDTQARILGVRGGFVVHAGSKLELYSFDLRLLKSYDLQGHGDKELGMWSAAVAPRGETIHLQPSMAATPVPTNTGFYFSGSGETEGIWLRSNTFEKIHTQMHLAGPGSVSDNAVVTRGVHCLELQPVGESSRNLCCSDTCGNGFPTFLSNKEILVTYREGFSVISVNGDNLWSRRATNYKELNWDETRSMNGLRFALAIFGASSHHATLDGVRIARPPENSILVYDTRCRKLIFTATSNGNWVDFALGLSPEGNRLAVLNGTSLAIYRLPEASCGSESP